jgi:hypothetical protein
MPCEPYKNALTAATATGADPQGDLRSHLAVCPSCHAAFLEERQLFAAIDAGLRATATAEVPASLFHRVRARLDAEAVVERNWLPEWMMIAATAALVLFAIAYQSKRPGAPSQDPRNSAVAPKASPPVVLAVPVETPSRTGHRQSPRERPRSATLEAYASVEQVSVLLPAGQKEALDGLLVSLQRGQVKGEVLLAQNQNLPLEDLRISPLDVYPIRMQPLAEVSGESQSRSTGAKP